VSRWGESDTPAGLLGFGEKRLGLLLGTDWDDPLDGEAQGEHCEGSQGEPEQIACACHGERS